MGVEVIALAPGLLFACLGKQWFDAQQSGDGVSRACLEGHVAFFAVAAITALFLHNWFSLLAGGADSLDGNHQAWVTWAAVDASLAIVLGVRIGRVGMPALAGRLGATPQLTSPQTGGGEHISNAGAQGRCRESLRS